LAKLPDTQVKLFDEQFVIKDPAGNTMTNLPYVVDGSDGKTFAQSETDGKTIRVSTQTSDKVKFALRFFDLE
jgi:type VI secretion system secreted protein VgrG